MQDLRALIQKYLQETNILQLATALDNQPWACNVHFFADENLNIYWNSKTDREHSRHIAQNPNVAGVLLVHENTPEEPYVIGVSIAGTAEQVDHMDEVIGNAYITKFNKPAELLTNMQSGKDTSKFYKLTPSKLVLFDTLNFPKSPRQQLF